MIGISLFLLKSRDAAQKGTRKKGTFLQKAGLMLDPYLPGQTSMSSTEKHNKTIWWITELMSASLTNDHPWDENDLMSDWGAHPQQPQATIGLPAQTEILSFLQAHSSQIEEIVVKLWKHCLPSEHAVNDSEEEDEVNDAFPVWHHHTISSTQMRLTLRWHYEVKLRDMDWNMNLL